MKLRSDDDDAI